MKPARFVLPLIVAGTALAIASVVVAAPEVGHAAADAAHAAHGHEHEVIDAIPTVQQGVATGVTALVVFALTAAFLGVFVWPKISKGLEDRERKIKDAIEEAEMARDQAKAALQEYERNLAQARAEAQRMLDEAKNQQQAIAAELRAKSEAELNQMREKAKRDIESAKAAAVIELNGYAASLATDMARKILKRDINAGDQQRLIQESLAELQGAGRN